MISVKDEGIILQKTQSNFEKKAVLNPACLKKGKTVHMFYRAIDLQDVSSIGYCQLSGDKVIKRFDKPILFPEFEYEKKGLEDPRIIYFEGKYYLFYTAYDGKNALIAYAVSTDLINFKKIGLISPRISYDEAEDIFRESKIRERYTLFEIYYKEKKGVDVLLWEKDASIFPERINGKIGLIHRVLPGIQILFFEDFSQLTDEFWRKYLKNLGEYIILDPQYYFESRNIGGGCPPIKTPEGWLLIYHAVEDTPLGKVYHAAAALLDIENPQKVIGRLREPLFSPKEPWEKEGLVKNVVFPTGAVVEGNRLFIYYGAADTLIAAKSVCLSELIEELKKNVFSSGE